MRNRSLLVALAVFGMSCGRHAIAQSEWDVALTRPGWDLPEFKQATEAFRREDCKNAWDILWPLAKKGNREARYLLWGHLIGGLIPPGTAAVSRSSMDRHHLTLAAYATLVPAGPNPPPGDPHHKWAREVIPGAIKRLSLGEKGDKVAQCYKSTSAFRTCLDLVVALGIVQRFEEYAYDVVRERMETGRAASCSRRAW